MKELIKKIYNKASVILAVICFIIMASEAETDEGIVIQLIAVAILGLLLFINRKKGLRA